MKTVKKVLSFVLVLVMLFSILPAAAFAAETQEASAGLKAIEVSMDSEILLWLKFNLSDELLNDDAAYAVITAERKSGKQETVVPMTEIRAKGADKNGRYVLEQGMASPEMGREVTVSFVDGSGKTVNVSDYIDGSVSTSVSRTVVDYAKLALEKGNAQQKELNKALLAYGGYAQKFFKVDTDAPVYDVLGEFGYEVPDFAEITADTLKQSMSITGDALVNVTTQQAFLDSSIYHRVYFTVDGAIEELSFELTDKFGTEAVEPVFEASKNRYYVQIDDIASPLLDYMYNIKITNAAGKEQHVKTSVLSYLKLGLEKSNDAAQLNLFKGIYNYNYAANSFFGDADDNSVVITEKKSSDCFGRPVTVKTTGDVVETIPAEADLVFTADVDLTEELPFKPTSVTTYVNGQKYDYANSLSRASELTGNGIRTEVFVDGTDVTVVLVETFIGRVTSVSKLPARVTLTNGYTFANTLGLVLSDYVMYHLCNGTCKEENAVAVYNSSNIKVGMFHALWQAAPTVGTVSGLYRGTNANRWLDQSYICLDGNKLEYAANYGQSILANIATLSSLPGIDAVGSEQDLYLNEHDYVLWAQKHADAPVGEFENFYLMNLASVGSSLTLYPWLSGYDVYEALIDGQKAYVALDSAVNNGSDADNNYGSGSFSLYNAAASADDEIALPDDEIALPDDSGDITGPTEVRLNITASPANPKVGDTVTFTITNLPDGASVTWVGAQGSGNTAKATAVEEGTLSVSADATATDVDGNPITASGALTVTVAPADVVATGLVISGPNTLSAMSIMQLTAVAAPTGATLPGAVTWYSSNTNVATVSQTGLVNAKALGTVTITAKSGNLIATHTITVTDVVVDVIMATNALTLAPNEKGYISGRFNPSSAGRYITTSMISANRNIATVDGSTGTVTAVASGSTYITVKCTIDTKAAPSYLRFAGGKSTWEVDVPVTVKDQYYIGNVSSWSTMAGSAITLNPVLYNGKGERVNDANFQVTPVGCTLTSNGNTFYASSNTPGTASVTFTVTNPEYKNDGAPVTKTVNLGFYRSNTLTVNVRDNISSFRFYDRGVIASSSIGNNNNYNTMSLTDLIAMAMPYTGSLTNVDGYSFGVSGSNGGELLAPSSGSSLNWTGSTKYVDKNNLDTVGFQQKSVSNNASNFTIYAMDGGADGVIVGMLTMRVIIGGTIGGLNGAYVQKIDGVTINGYPVYTVDGKTALSKWMVEDVMTDGLSTMEDVLSVFNQNRLQMAEKAEIYVIVPDDTGYSYVTFSGKNRDERFMEFLGYQNPSVMKLFVNTGALSDETTVVTEMWIELTEESNPPASAEGNPYFNGTLKTSSQGVEMIKDIEGYLSKPAGDYAQYSIGYGCNITYLKKYYTSLDISAEDLQKILSDAEPSFVLKEDKAEALMMYVLVEVERKLDEFLEKYGIVLNQYQYDSLVSFTYDLGYVWLADDSRLGEVLIAGNYTVNELASAMGVYCHVMVNNETKVLDLLVTRRIREIKLFLFGAYNLMDTEHKFCVLRYDAGNGDAFTDIGFYQFGQPYQILFEAEPTEETLPYFVGWYDETGKKITASTLVEKSMSVTAAFSATPADPELG